jgi:hypothetical protein
MSVGSGYSGFDLEIEPKDDRVSGLYTITGRIAQINR